MVIELTEEQVARVLVREGKKECRKPRVAVDSPDEIAACVRHMGLLEKEHYVVVTLDSRNQVIGTHVVSMGIVDAALVHPRETFRVAILDNANKIIVAHNHPSGQVEPSEDDILITKRLQTAGKILGIPVIDHLIVTANGFHSLQEHGQMRSA